MERYPAITHTLAAQLQCDPSHQPPEMSASTATSNDGAATSRAEILPNSACARQRQPWTQGSGCALLGEEPSFWARCVWWAKPSHPHKSSLSPSTATATNLLISESFNSTARPNAPLVPVAPSGLASRRSVRWPYIPARPSGRQAFSAAECWFGEQVVGYFDNRPDRTVQAGVSCLRKLENHAAMVFMH
jgi:hypothetical protein